MAIADTINSIETHLKDDYEALEQLGVSVEDRNIENIKDMANQIYSKFPKTDFEEGTNITLENTLKGKLDFEEDNGYKKLGSGDTKQDTLNGYNLIGLTNGTYTSRGITLVVDNGKVTINGTAEALTVIQIPLKDNITLTNQESYTLYAFNNGTSSSIAFRPLPTIGAFQVDFSNVNNVGARTFSEETRTIDSVGIRFGQGATATNLVCYPMIIKGSDTTKPYEPYCGGIQAPNPNYEIPVKVVRGKNLFDGAYVNALTGGASPYPYTENNDCRSAIIKVNPNTTYTISKSTSNRFRISEYSTQPQVGANATNYIQAGDSATQYTLTTQSTTKYVLVQVTNQNEENVKLQIELGSTATPYLPYNTLEVKVSGKNLFTNTIYEDISKNGVAQLQDNGYYKIEFNSGKNIYENFFKENTQYTISFNGYYASGSGNGGVFRFVYTDGTNSQQGITSATPTNYTLTSTSGKTIKNIFITWGSQQTGYIKDLQLEVGSTATTYEPYKTPITKNISLGDLEFAKIGEYADEILYDIDNDKFYKNQKIGKVVLNGSETVERIVTALSNTYRFSITGPSNMKRNVDIADTPAGYLISNKFVEVSNHLSYTYGKQGILVRMNNTNSFVITSIDNYSSTIAQFKTWLENNNVLVYYVIDTPTLTEITDTTLKEQLKDLYNMQSMSGTTIIEVDGDLPLNLKIRALKGE